MAVISFWGNDGRETGQTISMLSIATTMAIEHNHKIIIIGTGYNDTSIDDAYWEPNSEENSVQAKMGIDNRNNIGTVSGMEGLSIVVKSGRTGNNVIGNYTKPVFKDKRLDVLPPVNSGDYDNYLNICKFYPDVVRMANSDYNLVFVDINRKLPMDVQRKIIEKSDIVIVNLKQSIISLNNFLKLKKEDSLFGGKNIIVLLGKYDGYSKYNIKNIERLIKGQNIILGIAYNTLFYESATEGKMIDYFLKIRNITNVNDRNYVFVQQNKVACESILYKLKELQIR